MSSADTGNKIAEHVVHELRHVILALQATRRMLLRESNEFDVMADLQLQSIERIQGLVALYEHANNGDVTATREPGAVCRGSKA